MIKFVFRWAFRLLLLAVVLVIGGLLLKDNIARNLTEERIRRDTGFDTRIGKLEFSLFSPRVSLENVVMYNPPEFGGSVFLNIPDLHFEYDRKKLALGKLHLTFLRLTLTEFHIVENQHGRTNLVDVLHKVAPEILGSAAPAGNRPTFAGIDTLNLSLEEIRYTNLRLPRRNQEVKLGLKNDLTHNLRSEQDVAAVLFKVLLRAGVTFYSSPSTAAAPRATNTAARK
ncbi:MAG: hypothetical protein ACXW3Z_00595 [Limisphaerales bacterium]